MESECCELSLFDSTSQELFSLSPPYDGSELELDMPHLSDPDLLYSCSSPDAEDCASSVGGDDDLVSYLGGKKELKACVKDQSTPNGGTSDMVLRNRSNNTPNKLEKTVQMKQVLVNSKDLHDTQKQGVSVEQAKGQNTQYIVTCNNSRMLLQNSRVSIATNESSSQSKNAIAARENRQKKKQYVSCLEKNVQELSTENAVLRSKNKSTSVEVENLRMEVKYLKSVIANQSTLSGLLKNIGTTPGVQFLKSQSLEGEDYISDDDDDHEPQVSSANNCNMRKRTACVSSSDINSSKRLKVEHDYASCTKSSLQPARRPPVKTIAKTDEESCEKEPDCGVCLHVSNSKVSLEFCASCNQNATHLKH